MRRAPHCIQQHDCRLMKKIAHTQFRLGDDLHRSHGQRRHRQLGPFFRQAGAHHHRHRHLRHDFFQESQAVHARHLQIGDDHVGNFSFYFAECDQRIGGDAYPNVSVSAKHGLHHLAHDSGVVHHQHVDLFAGFSPWSLQSIAPED